MVSLVLNTKLWLTPEIYPLGKDVCEDKVDPSNSQSPQLLFNYHTSSEMIKATVGGVPTCNYRTYGVPTIRSDLPAPRIRRVSDHTVCPPQICARTLLSQLIHSCPSMILHVYMHNFLLFSLSAPSFHTTFCPLRTMVMNQMPMVWCTHPSTPIEAFMRKTSSSLVLLDRSKRYLKVLVWSWHQKSSKSCGRKQQRGIQGDRLVIPHWGITQKVVSKAVHSVASLVVQASPNFEMCKHKQCLFICLQKLHTKQQIYIIILHII